MSKLQYFLDQNEKTQSWLAEEIKVDKATINRWCASTRSLSWLNATRIAEALNCFPSDFFQENIVPKFFVDNDCWVNSNTEYPENDEKNSSIIVSNMTCTQERGLYYFRNKTLSPIKINSNLRYLIEIDGLHYCGFVSTLPLSGDFYIWNSNQNKTRILGNLSEITAAYEYIQHRAIES